MIGIDLADLRVNALIDTGASCSLIDIGSLEKLGLAQLVNSTNHRLINASGNDMNIMGSIDVEIRVNNKSISHNMKVLNSRSYRNILLGRDFLMHFSSIQFDLRKNRIQLDSIWHDFVRISENNCVKLLNNVVFKARSEHIVNVQCSKSWSLVTADFDPILLSETPGMYATRCRIIPNIEGVFQVSFLNTTAQQISLPANTDIGLLLNINDSVTDFSPTTTDNSENLKNDTVYGEHLSPLQRDRISSLISNFVDIFAPNPKKPTLVKNMEHRIITTETQPVNRKPYRIPHAWHSEIDTQISEMLQNDIIRHSSSPWNAPVILVKKKDGSMRFVCDFRGLNDVTKKDSYPLPHIRDVIDKMYGARYWTTLDAASAYWSMPLAEDDKEKTAFSLPRGKYEFNVTPFGLCNAGASYQRMMDITLSGLPTDRVLAYMDDVVIFSKTFEEHLTDIEHLFQRLRSSGVSLKLSKCVFASDKVDFLGFELSPEGIKPQARLTEAIHTYKQPSSKKELKAFLGLAGFYRAFIPNFAHISQPLNALTSEHSVYHWSEDCERAFNQLKSKLLSKPILQFPDLSQPFTLEVDASDQAVGGVLSQQNKDGRLHPVAYFSTALQKITTQLVGNR